MATDAEMEILRQALWRGEPVEVEEQAAPPATQGPRARWFESGNPPRDFNLTPAQLVELRGLGAIVPK